LTGETVKPPLGKKEMAKTDLLKNGCKHVLRPWTAPGLGGGENLKYYNTTKTDGRNP